MHSLVELTADVELLDRALEVGRAAYDAGGGAGGGAMVPLLLGQLHHVRYRHTLRPADLERAAALFGEVVGTTPYGGDDHVTALAGLGQVRFAEYLAGGDAEALRAAVVALGSTVRACAPDSPRRAEAQIAHGEALDAQYALGGDPGVLAAAGHAYREAARNEAVPPLTRVRAARAWALTEARAGKWRGARDTYALAVGLLPLVVPRRLARADQQRMLAELDGLASDAAAAALAAGDPEGAVLLLEQGRGLLGGQVLQGRDDLSGCAPWRRTSPAGCARPSTCWAPPGTCRTRRRTSGTDWTVGCRSCWTGRGRCRASATSSPRPASPTCSRARRKVRWC
ncbi:hypothetical protein AB7952_05060 [Streptomyces sp. PG2]